VKVMVCGSADTDMQVVTKNTFLHFDCPLPSPIDGLRRTQSCPTGDELDRRHSETCSGSFDSLDTPSDFSGMFSDETTADEDTPKMLGSLDRYVTEGCEPGCDAYEFDIACKIARTLTPTLCYSDADTLSDTLTLPEIVEVPNRAATETPPPPPPMPPIPKECMLLPARPAPVPTRPADPVQPAPSKLDDLATLHQWLAEGRVTQAMIQEVAAMRAPAQAGMPPPPPYAPPRPAHPDWLAWEAAHPRDMHRWGPEPWDRHPAERWGPAPWDRHWEPPHWGPAPAPWDWHHGPHDDHWAVRDWQDANMRPRQMRPRTEPVLPESGVKVFVGGLGPYSTSMSLREYFSPFGRVLDSAVLSDGQTKRSRGFGFVEFADSIPEGLCGKEHIIDDRRCGVREYAYDPTKATSTTIIS